MTDCTVDASSNVSACERGNGFAQEQGDSFAQALSDGFKAGKHLCVGIDPHAHLLDAWGLPDTAQGAEDFGRRIIAAVAEAGSALCVKPQIAFYERFGAAGYTALEQVFKDARGAGVTLIADIKRGDVGSTFSAYAEAWLTPGSPLEADAITAVAYQGVGSLDAGFELAKKHGKGIFVLAATSNPEAAQTQQAVRADGKTIAQSVISEINALNEAQSSTVGAFGVVLGATLKLSDFSIDTATKNTPILPILAPGFGAQGAKIEDAKTLFGELAEGLIANESRSILAPGAQGLSARISETSERIREALHSGR